MKQNYFFANRNASVSIENDEIKINKYSDNVDEELLKKDIINHLEKEKINIKEECNQYEKKGKNYLYLILFSVGIIIFNIIINYISKNSFNISQTNAYYLSKFISVINVLVFSGCSCSIIYSIAKIVIFENKINKLNENINNLNKLIKKTKNELNTINLQKTKETKKEDQITKKPYQKVTPLPEIDNEFHMKR